MPSCTDKSYYDCAGARSSERDSLVVHYKEEDCRPALDLVNQLEQETLHLCPMVVKGIKVFTHRTKQRRREKGQWKYNLFR